MTTQLTPHFTLKEFTRSDTAMRMGIDNTPPMHVMDELQRTAELCEKIREFLGTPMSITSGYRCEELEQVLTRNDFAAWCIRHGKISAYAASWQAYFRCKSHPQGKAADFKSSRFGTPAKIVAAIAANPDLMELIDQLIMEQDWVHVSQAETPRHEVLVATFKNGTPSYQSQEKQHG